MDENFNRNPNLKIIGFFGQSGSGKTTIIRNVNKKINGDVILHNTGIIRYLFANGKNDYLNPRDVYNKNYKSIEQLTGAAQEEKIDEIYEKYIRSQLQLLNDWSTEVYLATTESYSTSSTLLVDRSPIDFYVLTVCGINYLVDLFKKELNQSCKYLISLVRDVAQDNSNNFLNAIFVIKPWRTCDINKLRDGIRDQYLEECYTGDNWYLRYDDVKLDKLKTFVIDEDVIELNDRAAYVTNCLFKLIEEE